MLKYTVEVKGMMCGMCEAHMNDEVRKNFDVKKVTSNHSKNETVIISEEKIDEEKLRGIIKNTGYEMGTFKEEPYEKKGFFSFLKK